VKINSTGSSIVIIYSLLVLFISSNILVIVVDFHDQETQETIINQLSNLETFLNHSGIINSLKVLALASIFLITKAIFHNS
jgi:hypothetical protein